MEVCGNVSLAASILSEKQEARSSSERTGEKVLRVLEERRYRTLCRREEEWKMARDV